MMEAFNCKEWRFTMSENVKTNDAQPEVNLTDNTQTNEQEIFIPVKFNKQIFLNLPPPPGRPGKPEP